MAQVMSMPIPTCKGWPQTLQLFAVEDAQGLIDRDLCGCSVPPAGDLDPRDLLQHAKAGSETNDGVPSVGGCVCSMHSCSEMGPQDVQGCTGCCQTWLAPPA